MYVADSSFIQDPRKSVVENGKYCTQRYSTHEVEAIYHALKVTRNKYPMDLRGIGLANESWIVKYKAKYVLFEMIIQLLELSDNPLDEFSKSIAYVTKGAFFRKYAINFFEKSKPFVSDETLMKFSSFQPLNIHLTYAKVYESEHEYEKTISCMEAAQKYGGSENLYFKQKINELECKLVKNSPKRSRTMSEDDVQFEKDIRFAARYLIDYFNVNYI